MFIRFKTEDSLAEFHTMCEGMFEIARDDERPEADSLAELIGLTSTDKAQGDAGLPFLVRALTATQVHTARLVLENMKDSTDESAAALGDISLDVGDDKWTGEMGTREALETARELLEQRASETDTASPEGHIARLALGVIESMLAQRGCEHFDRAGDGTLTDLCDIIIFG